MAKIRIATQADLQATNLAVTNIENAISAVGTGIDARVTVNESDIASINQTIGSDDSSGLRGRISGVETDIGDANSGVVKQIADLESVVGTSNTEGLQKRVVDLESGGVDAIKFRDHSPSGVYKDGEVIDVDSRLYKAVGDIDGSVTPVPFSPVSWLEVSASQLPDYILGIEADSGQVIADADRFVHNDSSIMRQTSFTRIWAWIVAKASGAVSTILTSDLSTGKALASNAQGKIIASAISDTELSYLDNASSNIQTQINGKKPNYTNMYQMQSYGTVNGDNGSRVSGTGFSVTRAGEGHYRVYNLPYMDHNTAMIQLQSVSDPDNMYCLYDVGTNEFWVRFYDAPTMAQQDINFKFIISRLV